MTKPQWKLAQGIYYTREIAPGCPTLRIIVPIEYLPCAIQELKVAVDHLENELARATSS